MNRMKAKLRGFSVSEMMVALGIFGLAMTMAVTLFTLCNAYYHAGAAQIDVESYSQQAVTKLAEEIQESSPAGGVAVHTLVGSLPAVHDAIIFISARDTNNTFQSTAGLPNWQKWVCYYLSPDPNSSYSLLVRKESTNIFGIGLPSTTIPGIPGNWLTQFQNSTSATKNILASGISALDIEDINCGASLSPLYVQVTSSVTYAGLQTSYTPGYLVSGFTCVKTGYWVAAHVEN